MEHPGDPARTVRVSAAGWSLAPGADESNQEAARLLGVRDLRVAFADKTILHSVSFDLPRVGATIVMGPVGAGKSTLLRTLAGHLEGLDGFTSTGSLERSEELDSRPVALVHQSARLLMRTVRENLAAGLPDRSSMSLGEQRAAVDALLERLGLERIAPHLEKNVLGLSLACQRLVAIARCLASDPALLLVDEPTSGLEEADRRIVVALLERAASERHVLCITHNRKDALELGGDVLFLVDGTILERRPVREFLEHPSTREGEWFTQTGSCLGVPSRPRPQSASPAKAPIPNGFHWIRRGALAGVARPGLLADLDQDLRGLAALGINTLVCLEEKRVIADDRLAPHGITCVHFPIDDMAAPNVAAGVMFCNELHMRLAGGDRIAVHCRAGLGRTGTILCALLIYEGASALDALDAVRRVQWKFVQSDAQVAFLSALESRVNEMRSGLRR